MGRINIVVMRPWVYFYLTGLSRTTDRYHPIVEFDLGISEEQSHWTC